MIKIFGVIIALSLILVSCTREPDTDGQRASKAGDQNQPEVETMPDLQKAVSRFDEDTLKLLSMARSCDPETYQAPELELYEKAGDVTDNVYNQEISERFLTANAGQSCVFITPSGLQFTIQEASDSDLSPISGEIVSVHYRGRLLDGSEFDSSFARGEPANFPSDRLIRGWVEALPMMRVGERWTLYIDPDLAYGAAGAGRMIGPNQALIFDLELLGLPGRDE